VRDTARSYAKATALPKELVQRIARLETDAYMVGGGCWGGLCVCGGICVWEGRGRGWEGGRGCGVGWGEGYCWTRLDSN